MHTVRLVETKVTSVFKLYQARNFGFTFLVLSKLKLFLTQWVAVSSK